jgi:DNA (cytosine-5)-methyltransferase 1
MRPRIVFFENVEGHISLGLRDVIEELESLGYKTTWGIFSASEVGAPHQRKRVFILAYLIDERSQGWLYGWSDTQRQGVNGHAGCCGASRGVWPSRPGEPQHEWEPPRVVTGRETLDDSESGGLRLNRNDQRTTDRESNAAHITSNGGGEGEAASMGNAQGIRSSACGTEHEGLGGELCLASSGDEGVAHTHGTSSGINGKYRGQLGLQPKGGANRRDERDTERTENGIWQVEPAMGRDSDGSADWMDNAELYVTSDNRTDELRLLGNGVVPATATRAFLTLMDQLLKDKP